MPRGDGTGPAGMGPMTGRAAGYCAGFPVPGYVNSAGGRVGLRPIPGMYAAAPYARPMAPYRYATAYGSIANRAMGWFGRGFGRGFARGFARGGGRGRQWFGW